jgi:thiol-disulfide isomerase/thioredoxin
MTLSALDDAPVWLNSEPLTAEGLNGRLVLVDLWTYSCVNWLRTLPYVRAWHDRYRDRGLLVIGVHAPEFGFEHDLDNVRRAVAELDVGYPVVLDNDFAIWRAFENHYWPALYLVDRDGRVRFHHFGEGAYEETERANQQQLGLDGESVRVDAGGLSEAAAWDTLGPLRPTSATRVASAGSAAPSTSWGSIGGRWPANGRSTRSRPSSRPLRARWIPRRGAGGCSTRRSSGSSRRPTRRSARFSPTTVSGWKASPVRCSPPKPSTPPTPMAPPTCPASGQARAGGDRRRGLTQARHETNCWPPSMSYVAPVTAVLIIR